MQEQKELQLLIVEDDSVNAMLLEAMLGKSSLDIKDIQKAETLQEAFSLLEQHEVDAILLDLNLPDSNGLETLESVKTRHPDKPIIVITAEHAEEVGLQAIAKGAQEYLIKGKFNLDTLSKSIRYGIGRQETEEQVRKNERIFKTLINHLPQKVLLKDKQSRFIFCNKKYAEALNTKPEELTGKTDFDLYPAETAQIYITSDQKVIDRRKTTEDISRHTCGENSEVITRIMKTPVLNEKGSVEGVLCVFEDFTERIRAEESIKAANRELEKSNHQLKEMQSQLVQNEKLASIGQLAAGIAHEINNPMGYVTNNFSTLKKYIDIIMNIIQMYEQLLKAVQDNNTDAIDQNQQEIKEAKEELQIDYIFEDIPELFNDSAEGMNRVIKIVKNLRDFSRIDQAEDFDFCNLEDGIRSTLEVSRNELKYDTEIITDFGSVPDIYCNSGQLNQVFLNLLVNSAQAIASQQRESRGKIEIRTYSDSEYVICEIGDDGPGIPQENLSRIFDPFFTTKPVGKGTGLGLNLSYDIVVNKHKGQLVVDSEVGKGTIFKIKIPLNLEETLTQAEAEKDGCKENSLICG